jgi:hypothetical protein
LKPDHQDHAFYGGFFMKVLARKGGLKPLKDGYRQNMKTAKSGTYFSRYIVINIDF